MPDITVGSSDVWLARETPDHVEVTSSHSDSLRPLIDGSMLRSRPNDLERESILSSLYGERRVLLRSQRAGQTSPNDEEYLAELNDYIDHWEGFATADTQNDNVWDKLKELASAVLSVEAQIERPKK